MDETIGKQQQELARIIERHTPQDGTHPTAVPSLYFIRASRPSDLVHSIYEPALCIIAQGSKMVMLSQESYQYDPASYIVASVHLPISGQIIQATPQSPYLCLKLQFSPMQILDIIRVSEPAKSHKKDSGRGLAVSKMNSTLLDSVLRLVRLLDTPRDIPVLAPLVIREILYRVLQDEQGNSVKRFAMNSNHSQHIAKVIELIYQDYAKPLRIDELATAVNMSSSSLHHYFKEVTAMSPLQYQKQIRLQEARRLLLSHTLEAADAGFQVGYESPSQFSREYARMFGLPPRSDITRLRASLDT
ncbi:AraC family transcriptional regulator [Paenibacillus sp. S3N08]|uniref:AraC family transcriptional regulator n=2 Tax=Paenibacillus agricola TaxID=2716264 RepID=A0ABX0JA98_9BACL|nr:AraC family transcriptional regulator [Paenibacillus agricola]